MSELARQEQTQQSVANWFDTTYQQKGFGYLRPLAAYPIFLQMLGATPGEHLLDVACGPGQLLKAANLKGLRVTGIDISQVAIEMAKQHVPEAEVRVGNAEELPFADDTFDLLTCIGSLERMFDRQRVLAEMRRVVKPSGRLCLMLRNAGAPGWRIWRRFLRQQNHKGHQDAKGLREWRALLESAGFTIDAVHMDQWGRQKLRRLLRAGRQPDFSRPEPIAAPWLSMHNAYEFIFLLRP